VSGGKSPGGAEAARRWNEGGCSARRRLRGRGVGEGTALWQVKVAFGRRMWARNARRVGAAAWVKGKAGMKAALPWWSLAASPAVRGMVGGGFILLPGKYPG